MCTNRSIGNVVTFVFDLMLVLVLLYDDNSLFVSEFHMLPLDVSNYSAVSNCLPLSYVAVMLTYCCCYNTSYDVL